MTLRRPRRVLCSSISLLVFLAALQVPLSAAALGADQDEQIAALIEKFSGNFSEKQKAKRELAALGKAAVPALIELIDKRSPRLGEAVQTLSKIGKDARAALPQIKRILTGKVKTPEGWTWNVSPQFLTLSEVQKMEWAAKDLLSIVYKIAADEKSETDARVRATLALGGLGDAGLAKVRILSESDEDEVRLRAHYALSEKASQGRQAYFAEVLEAEPCDVNADKYVMHSKRIVNSGKLEPLTERVKVGLRECLSNKPDPQLAMTLARIINNQLAGTSIQWAAPSDSSSSRWDRESPKESFHTLLKVLELGFKHADKKSSLRREFGIAIARTHLLMGDWSAMNRQLKKMGQKTLSTSLRKAMTAPPHDWDTDLRKEWKKPDKAMASGDASFVLEVEKDGRGLAGVHVLLKPIEKKSNVFRSGINASTLFLADRPFGFMGGFGYRGGDIAKTRYGFTDKKGRVFFDKLPAGPLKVEVLVPTGNFAEEGGAWELWMEVKRGVFKVASAEPKSNSQRPSDPLSQVVLKAGQTTNYPKLVVRPKSGLNIHDFASVPAKGFELQWTPPGGGRSVGGGRVGGGGSDLRYEVELALSAPQESPSWLPSLPTLDKVTKKLRTTSLEIGPEGLGGKDGVRLVPGNLYWVRVTAFDAKDQVAFRSEMTRFWVPWDHRVCKAPTTERGAPVYHGTWWRRGSQTAGQERVDFRGMIAGFLKNHGEAFEREYTELGSSWLDWRDGKTEKAQKGLAKLVGELPDGNVVRATAKMLIKGLKAGGKCPKRLNFVGK